MKRVVSALVVLALAGCGRVLGADFDVPDRELGDSCVEAGETRCATGAGVAMCVDGSWQRVFSCSQGEHCENKPEAACIANDIDCKGSAGKSICVGTTAVVCDAEGNVAETSDCPGPCVDGQCLSIVGMALGTSFSCALTSAETVWCWGRNTQGQLGRGEGYASDSPLGPGKVVGLSGVEQLVAGGEFVCARTDDGQLYCWGSRVVTGSEDEYVVTKIPFSDFVVDVAASGAGVCARTQSEVHCWGDNLSGQLCTSAQDLVGPKRIDALSDATALYMGPRDTCARRTDESLVCCGESDFAGGMDPQVSFQPDPEEVENVSPVEIAAIGDGYMCSEVTSGAVYCWGGNYFGQLCLGHNEKVTTPTLSFLKNARAVAMGGSNTLAIDQDGTLRCCGAECGVEGLPEATITPFRVLPNVTSIAVGGAHRCAVLEGRALCWGSNSGGVIKASLGLDTPVVEPVPAGW